VVDEDGEPAEPNVEGEEEEVEASGLRPQGRRREAQDFLGGARAGGYGRRSGYKC